ncbi:MULTISPECIES: hypothetical protein [unclassified Bacillus (in: firmicutes)]|uniref:hypothetical protein n=1 Tax=Bacillaceae TaxID=186817 RepID=UPI000BF1406F|nr:MULTISPECIES: hypothetical protein [unclassified Bacillus (in: firmicutes)]PEJ56921.1 hypothetical protein CN692_15140 [Bacillus sp. AFS002410]PEL11348.1 hypothetical protein CN601_11445 [Bacillus sp. AFS017336]QKE71492.1 hypothetical protein HPK19_01150 [Arthrobacter citreus]
MDLHELHYEIIYLDKETDDEVKFKHMFHMDDLSHDLALNIASSLITRDKAHVVYIKLLHLDEHDHELVSNVVTVKRIKDGKIIASYLDSKLKKVVEIEL